MKLQHMHAQNTHSLAPLELSFSVPILNVRRLRACLGSCSVRGKMENGSARAHECAQLAKKAARHSGDLQDQCKIREC